MDAIVVVLVIGVAALIAGVVLLWRNQTRGGGGRVVVRVADLVDVELELTPTDRAQAKDAIRTAEAERGGVPTSAEEPQLAESTTAFARVLWVDDLPDNNLYETVALEKLGKFVTKATSTEAALRYLDRVDFTLLITDLGRSGDRDAGLNLIRHLRASGSRLPIVVYTGNAGLVRGLLLEAGADAVVDQPGALIRAVESRIGHPVAA